MERYTLQQRVEIVNIYYQNQCSVRQTLRALRRIYGIHRRPAESTIRRLMHKFETTGSVVDEAVPVRQRNARSLENIVAVRDSVRENPGQSIPSRALELGLSATSIWRILRRDLGSDDVLPEPEIVLVEPTNVTEDDDKGEVVQKPKQGRKPAKKKQVVGKIESKIKNTKARKAKEEEPTNEGTEEANGGSEPETKPPTK